MKNAWLGSCRLFEGGVEMEVLAAVWCADVDGFDAALRPVITSQGARFSASRDAMPAAAFLARYGANDAALAEGASLAREIGPNMPVSLGMFRLLTRRGRGANAAVERLAVAAPLPPVSLSPFDLAAAPAGPNTPEPLHGPLFDQGDPAHPLCTYAILDAAHNPSLPQMLYASQLPFRCLFDGDKHRDLQSVAPYLVSLESQSNFTRHLFTGTKGQYDMTHGPFLRSPWSFDRMHAHLAACTMTRGPNGGHSYFRFWEDCVLDYIGFFGGLSLGRKLFPDMLLLWSSGYYTAGRRFVMTKIDAV